MPERHYTTFEAAPGKVSNRPLARPADRVHLINMKLSSALLRRNKTGCYARRRAIDDQLRALTKPPRRTILQSSN
jgi:hypothetical protein